MGGYLREWWVWLVIIVVVLVVIFLYTRLTGDGIRDHTPTEQDTATATRQDGVRIVTLSEESDLTPALPRDFDEDRSYSEYKQSHGERECLRVMERVFHPRCFEVQQRLDFMRNPETDRRLELDIYNKDLAVAVEYNGRQHYFFTKKFHQSVQDFEAQVRRDNYKRLLCARHGIYLIEVPYNVAIKDIERFILNSLPESLNKYRRY